MAIEKVEKTRKFEFSTATVVQLGSAAAIFIASCIVGYFAFAKWRFKVALVSAYEAYDSNQIGVAKPELQSALSWRPDHPGARELLAKLHCEGGQLEDARREYERLRAQRYDPPQVKVGMGVVLLRMAELKEGKEAVALAEQARKEFQASGNLPEAHVGIGHVELLLAHKTGDATRLDRARNIFTQVKTLLDTKPDYARQFTREGLLDFYSGLGKVLASGGKYDPGAAPALRASFQYSRRWVRPLATLLVVEAKRFAEMKDVTNDELLKMHPEMTAFRNEMGNLWKMNRDAQPLLKDPWLMHGLAVASAFARVGNMEKYLLLFNELTSGREFQDRLEPFLLDAGVRTDVAIQDNPNASVQDKFIGGAMNSYTNLVQKLTLSDDLSKDRRARALNNLAWMEAWRGGLQNNQALHARALDRTSEATKLFPDEYVYNRNVLVLLKRLNRPANAYQPYLEKAKAAATGDWAEDFEKLQKYLGVQ